jgi:hypothetical protein
MFSKLREGGLMQAEYLAACFILKAGNSIDLDSVEFDVLLQLSDPSKELANIIQFWRIQQLWERLLGHSELALNTLPPKFAERLCQQSGVDTIEALIVNKEDYSTKVQSLMNDCFEGDCLSELALDQWLEAKVSWLDSE